MRLPTENATLALLLEVAAAPTPGNVDRGRDHSDLHFEQFLAGAVGAQAGLERAAAGASVGEAFERAVDGMSSFAGENTQFGALLLLVPLVKTAADGPLTAGNADATVQETTVADAAEFYRAFEHVDVRVEDPPDEFDALDVRRGKEAIPALERRELTLYDVLEVSADRDGVAREWTTAFERTMGIAGQLSRTRQGEQSTPTYPRPDDSVEEWITSADRLVERAARTHLWVLASVPDSLVITAHDEETAAAVQDRARTMLPDEATAPPALDEREAFARQLIDQAINPGMTADLLAAGLFVALERDGVAL